MAAAEPMNIDPRATMNRQGGTIAILMCFMLGFCLWALVFRTVPPENQNALLVVIGVLSAGVQTVLNFYFSSTASSKKQQETIGALADTAKAAQAALAPVTAPADVTLGAGETATVKAEP